MTVTAIEGVTYALDWSTQAYRAKGRPSLPLAPPVVQPTTIYAGAIPLGATSYDLPAVAVRFVAPNGSNSNAGSLAAPYATVQYAINQVPAGGTIVVRGGTYHESLTSPNGKIVKIQAYPGEIVWFDGSSVYTGWTSNGNGTWSTSYSLTLARFSAFPGSDPYRGYTDMCWVDGTMLTQIADNTTPGAGQFSVNQTADTITIGTNPTGKTVRCSDLATFLTASGRCDLYGIGIRRYAPQSQEGFSAMAYYGGSSAGTIIENCVWEGSAVSGLNINKLDIVVRSCTFQDNMHVGLSGTTCGRGLIEYNLIRRNNIGLYDQAPVTGGMKFTRADQMVIRWNIVKECPKANLIWMDVSCTRTSIYGNDLNGADTGKGFAETCIFVEISDGGIYGGTQYRNWIVGNRTVGGKFPLRNVGSGYSNWWNNSCSAYATNTGGFSMGQDREQNAGDPGNLTKDICPWWNTNVQCVNNDIGLNIAAGGIGILAYSDFRGSANEPFTGWDMFEWIAGNWVRTYPPGSMCQMGLLDGTRQSFNTWTLLANSGAAVGGPPGTKLGTNYQGSSSTDATAAAVPVTAPIAALLGVPVGTKIVGPNTANLPVIRPGI